MFAGRIHGFDDGEGGDGKGCRDAMGGFNAAGCGCKGWRNENCTVHTATLSRNLPAEQLCQPRVVEDARSNGRVVLGMTTLGILRFFFKEMGQLAAMLNKEAILAQILPYLQRDAQTEGWNVPIHTSPKTLPVSIMIAHQ